MNVCPHCDKWDIANDDIFCSWCGYRLVGIQAELRRNRFSLQDPLPPPVDLFLSNRSDSAPITVESVTSSENWIKIELDGKNLPLLLPPHATEVLTVRVEIVDLKEEYHSGSILVRTDVGEESLRIDVFPAPELEVSAYSGNEQRQSCRFEILLDGRNLERNLVRIAARKGVIAIENISTDQPDWIAVRLPADCKLPVTLDERKSRYLDIFLDVDENALLKKNPKLPAEYKAELIITTDELTRQQTLVFECWQPPLMWIWQEDEPLTEAWPGQRHEVLLTIQNSVPGRRQSGIGNVALQISRIELLEPDGKPCEWLKPVGEPPANVAVPGGEYREIRYFFEADGAGKNEGNRLGIGRHAAILVFTTNLIAVTYKMRLEVNVQPVRDFDGVLAIDFGTSNTCCAVFRDSTQAYDLVPIDRSIHNLHPTTAPTVTQYLTMSPNGFANVVIGAEVDALELSARVIRSVARSPKRHLGTDESFEIYFFNSPEIMEPYPARKVTCDYLREVRTAAERYEPGVRFRKLVITHPSRFKLRQIMELKEAVKGAFGNECEIQLLPEPVAAALGFIMDKELLQKERYTVGVFDFGGGTTDLALIEIINEHSDGFVEVIPRQLNATGRWFGGEDLSAFVYQRGLARIQEIVTADYKEMALHVNPKSAFSGNQRRVAIENHGRLLQWAEYSKLLLFEYGDDEHKNKLPSSKPDLFPALKLSLWTGAESREGEFRHDQIVPKRADLDAFLRPHIEELAADLAELVTLSKSGPIDFVRLSGKSSAIPLVQDVLAQRFPQAQLRLAAEPKECVVEGACILYKSSFAHRAFPIFENADFVQTTSRIGIEDSGEFVQVIGLGVPVAADGVVGEYKKFPLRPGARIRLLENTSLKDPLPGNKDISLIGTFKIDPSRVLSKGRAVPARLELRLSQDLTPTLVAYVPDGDPVPFVLEGNHATPGGGK